MRPRLLLVLTALLAALALPAGAQALQLRIVNESSVLPEDVHVTITGSPFEVSGMANDVPKTLKEIEENPSWLDIEKLVSGRVYISYYDALHEAELGTLFRSPTRFDWAELTVTPVSTDKANLTAVEQTGIGMRLDTFDSEGHQLEELGSANSDAIFEAMQKIPGGPAATVRNGEGKPVRVISPQKAASYPDLAGVYPDLGDYVRSMAGETIALHTAFFGSPFTTSSYAGTFAGDGSITLTGTSNPPNQAPSQISFQGDQLIDDIETGVGTPNTLQGTIRRDVLSAFSAGLWGGRYGNSAIDFCTNPTSDAQGTWCPEGFNQPAFGGARASLSPFPTCEQYAAVIAHYTDTYGNPYSDASGKVQISLDQPGDGGQVETLQLTILPDSGDAQPVSSANSECGAGSTSGSGSGASTGGGGSTPSSGATPRGSSAVAVHARLLKHSKLLRRGKLRVARLACSAACGRVRATVRVGRRILARALVKRSGRKRLVVAQLTKPGRKLLRRHKKLKTRLDLWVAPPGQHATHRRGKLLLLR